MRMIDVDPVLLEIKECKVMQQSENSDYRTGYISAMSTVEGIIADRIIAGVEIDAIPVEWLKAQNTSTEYYKTVQGQAVELVLELWQKEQEAR